MSNKEDYNHTFKTTLLFGFVQVINVAVKAIINKVAAVVLGPSGIGLIGLLTSISGVIKTTASLGISQSIVKDISEQNAKNDIVKYSRLIKLTHQLLLVTSLLGFLIACLIIPFRNALSAGALSVENFVHLGLAVTFITLWEGQLAILKGMRKLRYLAKANIIASLLGLFLSCFIYIYFEDDGIIPVLVLTPFIALLVSRFYVKKIQLQETPPSDIKWMAQTRPIIKTGLALSFATILSQLTVFLTSLYIVHKSGLTELGYYNVGILMMVGYFSVIINAITTDYYPRISAISDNNTKIGEELNKQSMVSLMICLPIFVIFIFILPFALPLLFSEDFLIAVDFIKIGVFGTLITILSNQFDLILVVKRDTKIFIVCALILRVIELICNLLFFHYYGLVGLGWSIVVTAILHMVIMMFIINKLYNIKYHRLMVQALSFVAIYIFFTTILSVATSGDTKLVVGVILVLLSLMISYVFAKNILDLNLSKALKI